MKRTEIILASLAILGIMLKIYDVAGAFFLSLIFIMLIALFHYVFSFALLNEVNFKNLFNKEYYKQNNIDTKKILSAVFLGWSLSIIEIAILFNLAYWPGREEMMWAGMISTLLFGLIFIFINKKNKKLVQKNLYRMLIVLILGFIAINSSLF